MILPLPDSTLNAMYLPLACRKFPYDDMICPHGISVMHCCKIMNTEVYFQDHEYLPFCPFFQLI